MDLEQNSSRQSPETNVAVVFGASGDIGGAIVRSLLMGKLFDALV
jgi:hypothetical protein